jgi:hypothetical protein
MVWCASNASIEIAKIGRTTADDLNQISGSKRYPTTSRCEQRRPDVQGFAGARRAVCEHGIVFEDQPEMIARRKRNETIVQVPGRGLKWSLFA